MNSLWNSLGLITFTIKKVSSLKEYKIDTDITSTVT